MIVPLDSSRWFEVGDSAVSGRPLRRMIQKLFDFIQG